ncbi:hypothetical protein NDU88_000111 [Pleurodeles waltl]|uniref:Uncharacterized protein n=1 Tax=Pleurodeles waltl TaxID=8319 RepID=A0AAV7U3N6_PLEWA|nr:hypothetical protein NDU88_000111 [Pleurodeles waltl]
MTRPLSTRNTNDPWRGEEARSPFVYREVKRDAAIEYPEHQGPLERGTPGDVKRDAALEYGEVKRDAALEYSEHQGPLERGTPGEAKSDAVLEYSEYQGPLER